MNTNTVRMTTLMSFILLAGSNAFCGDSLHVVANGGFEIESVDERSPDTLVVVTCSDYVYSPFGKLKSPSDLKTSVLKGFRVRKFRKNQGNGTFQYYDLTFRSSHLILFFDDDPEAGAESYVMKGEITDRGVRFATEVTIGMTREEFAEIFFASFPKDRLGLYKAIVFESCVTGTRHIYVFNHNTLQRVRLESVGSNWTF